MTEQKEKAEKYRSGIVLGKLSPRKVYGMGIGKITSILSYTLATTEIIKLADEMESQPSIQAVGVVNERGKSPWDNHPKGSFRNDKPALRS